MKYPSLEAVKQHAIVASVVLFALACACLPPAESMSPFATDGAPATQPPAPDVAQPDASDFVASGGLVPDALAAPDVAESVAHAAASMPDLHAGGAARLE